jgi:ATP-dependent exoDNAse (exonuclease V) beta subunit
MTLVGHPEPRLVDEAERDRIVRSGLDETLFVEAGAGTGKTHALVGRVEHLVIDAGIRLDTIAAITFTEAAAAELRDRIRERFERRLDDPGLDPATAARCEQALADADDAAIGTLHGFCLRILGEHPVDVKLPPRVEILDEVRSQLAFEERWSAFVDDLFSDPTAEELILRAWALGVAVEPRGGGSVSLKDVASVLDDSWDRLDAVAAEPDALLAPVDFSAVDRAVAGLREIATTCRNPQDGLLAKIEQLRHELTAIAADAGADTQRRLALYRSYLPRWRRGNSGAAKWWDDKAAAQAAYDRAKGAVEAVRDAATDEVLRGLTRRLARFILASAEHRRAEGQLEFHDLLVLARQLVRESGAARRSLHDRYTRLLLDEFQDTDPIQIEVAVLIAAAVTGDDELIDSPWSAVATDTGRLFFVGDPKQSIYRFRRADIALFLAARDTFSGSAGPLQLRENFRTVAPIVDWVNAVFSLVMAAEVPGAQPAYQPLSAHRQLTITTNTLPWPLHQRTTRSSAALTHQCLTSPLRRNWSSSWRWMSSRQSL